MPFFIPGYYLLILPAMKGKWKKDISAVSNLPFVIRADFWVEIARFAMGDQLYLPFKI
jgi:hypothetical protein